MNRILSLSTIVLLTQSALGQDKSFSVKQDPQFMRLLTEKRKLNESNKENDNYQIQIFSGNREEAEQALRGFKKDFKDIDGTIIYNSPNYKVRVGSYNSLIEAKRKLLIVREKIELAFIIKPKTE